MGLLGWLGLGMVGGRGAAAACGGAGALWQVALLEGHRGPSMDQGGERVGEGEGAADGGRAGRPGCCSLVT